MRLCSKRCQGPRLAAKRNTALGTSLPWQVGSDPLQRRMARQAASCACTVSVNEASEKGLGRNTELGTRA